MNSNDDVVVDRISKFPDEVLNDIFSSLPIRDVVRTSILSKRWEYAWTSAPCLDFIYASQSRDVDSETKLACFSNFVDRVLFYHGGSSIQKCAFYCHSSDPNPFPSLSSWICVVLASNVQDLYVSSSYDKAHELPPSLFTCRTLVKLNLDGNFLLNLPFRVCFPNLKTLGLACVIFVDDFSMQRLFYSCPVLEDLEINRNGWNGVLIASISVPSLKRLVIDSLSGLRVTEKDDMYKMVINAPCLERLMITDNALEELSVSSSNYLVKAYFGVSCALKVLKDISNVQELRIFATALQNPDDVSNCIVPIFHKLTSFWLEYDHVVGQNLLSPFLRFSPNLEVLYLTPRVSSFTDTSPWNPPNSYPACLLLSLKRIVFRQFLGTKFELSMVRYMLEYALVLEDMTIFVTCSNIAGKFTPKMRDAILLYKRGSRTCKVQFIGS